MRISGNFTAVMMATVGLDPANRSAGAGSIELMFDVEVTENLDLFMHLEANNGPGARFPARLPPVGPLAEIGVTFSGLSDGIGVDGDVGYAASGRVLAVNEAGMRHRMALGKAKLTVEMGSLDPRTRFHQVAFADDNKTQYINNIFADSSAVQWMTNSTGRSSLGLHISVKFGENDQFEVSTAWFNAAGTFFNSGQWFIQVSWHGQVNDRDMNLRLFGFLDEFNTHPVTSDGESGGGLAWDWWVHEKIGVFFRIATNTEDINPIELDASFGAVFVGLIGSRPKDVIGIGLAIANSNSSHFNPAIAGLPQDSEKTVEIYYTFMAEDGKLQITFDVQIVTDPGGNGTGWLDDTLVVISVRIHVPF